MNKCCCYVLFLAVALLAPLMGRGMASGANEPPAIPVGLDAYRQWDHWPYQRIGERAFMRSTYDRSGGNEGADASHFLYQLADDFNVTLDVEGSGVLSFVRFNHWHGSPWHFEVDGTDHLVQESSTIDPTKPVAGSVFLPPGSFPEPLAWTWATTKGADLIGVPMPFEKSLRLAYSRTHYGTGYYIYQQFVPGIPLSQPIRAWNGATPPAQDVLDLVSRAGADLAPHVGTPEGNRRSVVQTGGEALTLPKNDTLILETIHPPAPAMLRALEFSAPRSQAVAFGQAHLRVTWDDRSQPSIAAPVALFFGAGTLYNRDGRPYLVKAFPVHVRFDADRVYLACYFPMPFFRSAKIELVGNGTSDLTGIQWSVRYEPFYGLLNQVGYFHATYRDHANPVRGHDLVLLDTRQTEGGGDWTGSFVGTSFVFSDRARLGTLEGDPRFFFDDSQSPQAQGTGTEEWAGGGDYWGGANMTLPFVGHPVGARDEASAKNDEDKIESAYRFLLADLMPFGKNAVICLEHGGTDESDEHYKTVTYWYGLPGASLIRTDSLQMGDAASENAHHYLSPTASAPYEITSRYELGPDTIGGSEVYPHGTDRGRTMTGASEFTLKLTPHNLGVMLRRKLDYSFPNQRAEVYIADEKRGRPQDWKVAGVWYLAGSNTCVYSNPGTELGAAQHIVETSNRLFRDDEFLVPRKLTEGRSAIRVRVKFTAVNTPLFPGRLIPNLVWSEIRYDAYCFVMPTFIPPAHG
ncbi:MAG: DUF2961 domain-containing protein [Armatimonadota bacterium]|nr:DUF2961 domain-containing protein [Armatimonadota bacterium]